MDPLWTPKNTRISVTENIYIHTATSENTRLAYQADIDHFLSQGYALPTTPEAVERYLLAFPKEYNGLLVSFWLRNSKQSNGEINSICQYNRIENRVKARN